MTSTLTADSARDGAVVAAQALAAAGLRAGERVAIVTPEHRGTQQEAALLQGLALALALGALRSGIIPVMINPLLTADEREYIIGDAGPSLVVGDGAALRSLFRADGAPVELAEHPLARPMHYTSGTTGRPKGVWTADLSEAESAALWSEEQRQWGFDHDDVSLVHGPLCHSGPLRYALSVLLAGGSVVLPGWFTQEAAAQALVEERPTTAFVVPSHMQRLLAADDVPPSPYRLLTHAGAACPAGLKRAIHEWAGVDRVWEFYGSTEGQFSACSGPEWEERPGTVGRAREGRRLFVDDDVIWCEAPEHARFSYWRDEAKTARAWRLTGSGRAFTVGDLGRLDPQGYLFIDGRREDLIISGGVNVYPAEVEAVLGECPGVEDVVVFGRDDPRWGQRVCAAFTGDADSDDLRRWGHLHLAGYKRPKQVHHVSDFPRTASGKIRRSQLADAEQ